MGVQTRPAIVQAVRTQSAGSTLQSGGLTSVSERMIPGVVDGDRVAVEVGGGNGAPIGCSVERREVVRAARSSVMVSQRQTLDATDVADKPERQHATHHLDI